MYGATDRRTGALPCGKFTQLSSWDKVRADLAHARRFVLIACGSPRCAVGLEPPRVGIVLATVAIVAEVIALLIAAS